jgi:Transcription termination and cleavage factor C-terminal
MLLQVLRLTQDQISQLPPSERDAILALVSSSRKKYSMLLSFLYQRSQLGNLA